MLPDSAAIQAGLNFDETRGSLASAFPFPPKIKALSVKHGITKAPDAAIDRTMSGYAGDR